jgi:histidinol-phosphatase
MNYASDAVSIRMEALGSWIKDTRTLAMAHFRKGVSVESKTDGSPVTEADRAIERLLAESIHASFPEDTLLGEEHGVRPGSSPWRWLVDPIDGTASFIRGIPLWGTLVGLEHCDDAGHRAVVAGIADFPALDEQLVAPSTEEAWWISPTGTIRCRTSSCTDLRQALVCTTSTEYFRRAGCLAAWERLGLAAGSVRGWSDCSALLLLATGRVDAVVDPVMHPWDIGPFAAILPASGASWSSLDGATHHLAGSLVTAATPALQRAVLEALHG